MGDHNEELGTLKRHRGAFIDDWFDNPDLEFVRMSEDELHDICKRLAEDPVLSAIKPHRYVARA